MPFKSTWNTNLNKALTGLLLFMACMAGASQSAMDVSATLLALAAFCVFLVDLSKNRKTTLKNFPRFGWEWVIGLWLCGILASYLNSPLPESSALEHWLPRVLEVRWILLAYFLSNMHLRLKFSQFSIKCALGFIAFASFWAIMIFVIRYDPLRPGIALSPLASGLPRSAGLLGHAITFGHVYVTYFCFLTGIGLYLSKFPKIDDFKNIRLLFWITYILLAIALIVNFTRGAWMEMIFVLILGGFIMHRNVGAILTGFIFALTSALFIFSPGIRDRVMNSIDGGEERIWIWKANWAMFRDYPWLGVGYGDNKNLIGEYYTRIGAPTNTIVSHAHNQYLHMLAGTGVISTFFYLLMWVLLVLATWKNFKRYQDTPAYAALLLGVFLTEIGFFIGGLTEANYEHSKIKTLLCCMWALVLYFNQKYLIASDHKQTKQV